jgi:UDP-glucose 4-epimerase
MPGSIIVTGGAGFIGSHLADRLILRGDQVTVVDDLSAGRLARLDSRVTLCEANITDAAAMAAIVRKVAPEVIFHLAARADVRQSVAGPMDNSIVNIAGTVNTLVAAQQVDARVIFASTGGALYGDGVPVPSAEDTTPQPESPYGTSKYCAEQYIWMYNRLYGTRHSVLRLGNVYGPRQDPTGETGVVGIFCGQINAGDQLVVYGDGSQARDYVYVADVIEAFLLAVETEGPGVWNIGTGIETTVRHLIDLICQAAGKDVTPRYASHRLGELQRSVLATNRAAADLSWEARTPLATGIKKVYQWVQEGKPDRTEC